MFGYNLSPQGFRDQAEIDRLKADRAELLAALRTCREAMLMVRHDPYTTCHCAERLSLADRAANAAIAKAERGKG